MANKNWGKMEQLRIDIDPIYAFQVDEEAEPVVLIPGRVAIMPGQGDQTWWQLTKDIRIKPGQWFIAVRDDGFICMCEADPNMILLFDTDIWQIEHPGPRDVIFCHVWDGEKVVPYENPA